MRKLIGGLFIVIGIAWPVLYGIGCGLATVELATSAHANVMAQPDLVALYRLDDPNKLMLEWYLFSEAMDYLLIWAFLGLLPGGVFGVIGKSIAAKRGQG